jgi:hypothetical protein
MEIGENEEGGREGEVYF